MNAMVWWDHETDSHWSQPIGAALEGQLAGVRLEMVPVEVIPWSTWRKEHPDTLVLKADSRVRSGGDPFGNAREDYVVGVFLNNTPRAFYFDAVSRQGVVNDDVAGIPVVVFADEATRGIRVFSRWQGSTELQFEKAGPFMKDSQTGSLWDPATGFAVEGPLKEELLKEIAYSTAYDWAWEDFYPESEFYRGP